MDQFQSFALSDLPEIASYIIEKYGDQKIFTFTGPMGSGKTSLIKEICTQLGCVEEASSPTFSIVNEYHKKDGSCVYHFDFYRLDDLNEALDIGCEEYFYSGNPCFIEWPELISDLLPETFIKLELVFKEKDRTLTIKESYGEK